MACAIILAEKKKKGKKKLLPFRVIKRWLNGFTAAEIILNRKELREGFVLYIITMPSSESYLSKNKHGKIRTMRSWQDIIKEKQIGDYLIENSLLSYMGEGWSIGQKDLLTESLKQKVDMLADMEPLQRIKFETMTITVSGIKKECKTKELLNFLKRFRNVNTIEENEDDVWWEDFMTETGVPVCKTIDLGVLERSDVWLSYDDKNSDRPFNGIKVDIRGKKIICADINKQYRIGYCFPHHIISILGSDLIHSFGYELLSNFLLTPLMAGNGYSLDIAEKTLGIEIMLMAERYK